MDIISVMLNNHRQKANMARNRGHESDVKLATSIRVCSCRIPHRIGRGTNNLC